MQQLTIKHFSRTILNQTAHNFAVVDPYSATPNLGIEQGVPIPAYDLTGDKMPDLVIRTWTGGAHCCYIYDIYSLGPTFKKIWHFDAGDGHMLTSERSERNERPTLYMEDAVFRYWRNGIYEFPVVPIRWNGLSFAVDKSMMAKSRVGHGKYFVSQVQNSAIHTSVQNELEENFLRLYYSGRAVEAKKLIPKIKMPNESENQFHADFLHQLKKSLFYPDVLSVNKNNL
jgi:hypothetical protein